MMACTSTERRREYIGILYARCPTLLLSHSYPYPTREAPSEVPEAPTESRLADMRSELRQILPLHIDYVSLRKGAHLAINDAGYP